MKWRKAPEELVAFLVKAMQGINAEPKQMFGFPVYFINGQYVYRGTSGESDTKAL